MELITGRLILREFHYADWPDVLAYRNDERYLRYYEAREYTAKDVQAFIEWQIDRQQEQPRSKFQLVVTLKTDGRLIGNCGVRMDTADARQADIGYEIAPDYWGQGYATEAARAVVRYGFTVLKVHRIWAECIADNLASARVLEKAGLRLEGRLRENQYFKGRWWDTLLYGMLETEFDHAAHDLSSR